MNLDDHIRELVRAETAELRRQLEALKTSHNDALGFTLQEVSARFLPGVPVATLREWVKAGKLVAHLTPGERVYLVYAEDLRAFLDALKAKAPDAVDSQAAITSNVRRIISKRTAG